MNGDSSNQSTATTFTTFQSLFCVVWEHIGPLFVSQAAKQAANKSKGSKQKARNSARSKENEQILTKLGLDVLAKFALGASPVLLSPPSSSTTLQNSPVVATMSPGSGPGASNITTEKDVNMDDVNKDDFDDYKYASVDTSEVSDS